MVTPGNSGDPTTYTPTDTNTPASATSRILPDNPTPHPSSSPIGVESPATQPSPMYPSLSMKVNIKNLTGKKAFTPETHGPTKYFTQKLQRPASAPARKSTTKKSKNRATPVSDKKQRLLTSMLEGIVPIEQGEGTIAVKSQNSS